MATGILPSVSICATGGSAVCLKRAAPNGSKNDARCLLDGGGSGWESCLGRMVATTITRVSCSLSYCERKISIPSFQNLCELQRYIALVLLKSRVSNSLRGVKPLLPAPKII